MGWDIEVSPDVEATGPRMESKGWMFMIVPVMKVPLQILTWRRRWSCRVKEILHPVHLNCLFQWNASSCLRMFQICANVKSQSGHLNLLFFVTSGGLVSLLEGVLSILVVFQFTVVSKT